jgi:CBS domain containing-hemolysin-like protein
VLEIGLRILGGSIILGLNAYFVAIEFALTRLRWYPKSEFDMPSLGLADDTPARYRRESEDRPVPDKPIRDGNRNTRHPTVETL